MCCTDFAAILFNLIFKRRSEEINGEEANDDAAANNEATRGSSSTHTSTEGRGMATSLGYDYEVFLSFRGPDTRARFTDFLYTRMIDMGIRAYKDDEDLRKGEEFDPKLLQAIKQSKISIPIFSKGYASSVWCLKELVQMVACQKAGTQKIMPIFYDVAPCEVRHQTKDYKKAFSSHKNKKRHDEKTIQEWKDALTAVAGINGWDLQSMSRQEGEFARKVTHKVFEELKKAYLVISEHLVNVDNHIDTIMEMIGAGTSETRIIGIHGMGGIGKTTIAKLIYNKLLQDFENYCFLCDIRETSKGGIQCLQNQLISDILKTKSTDIKDIGEGTQTIKDILHNKRVLLLLDDVEEENHIDALVGKRDCLGEGSKIIITTRNKDILNVRNVDHSYELHHMDFDRSLQLFSKHAFRRDSPFDDDMPQSHRVIGIAGGLPLTLEVLGSLLGRTEKEKWDPILKKLESIPHKTVQSKLKISYDALDDQRQQHIFLDIACLFIGYDKDIIVHFWDESKFPEEAIEVLQNKSLIKIESNKVWMHDQLRDLGREIVRQESEMKIEKQSRVWDPKEALHLLRTLEGKTPVEALCLHFDQEQQYRFTFKDFERISNLRFLEVQGSKEYFCAEERLLWHESPTNLLPIDDFQENPNLLPQLRWLSWDGIPPTFKITNFSMEYVVILNLSSSKIMHDWEGWSHMKVMKNLKVMNLTSCLCLERTPNFFAHSKLERLSLVNCRKLVEIDVSICQLKSLVFLDVELCINLQRLPDELGRGLTSLKCLTLSYCTSLKRLPNTIGDLKSLNELNISRVGIAELPGSIGFLKELPNSIGQMENLEVMNMRECKICKIPDAFWTLQKLKEITVITTYGFDVEIGNGIYKNLSLRSLRLLNGRIYVVPRLPESLIILKLSKLYMNTFPDFLNLTNLKELELKFVQRNFNGESDGPMVEDLMPLRIENLSKLESLRLTSPYVTTLPTDSRSLLPRLKSLKLWCPNLCCLPSLPSSLLTLRLYNCKSCCSMEDLSNLKTLSDLEIVDSAISEIRGLDHLENLNHFRCDTLPQVEILPDLSNLNKLGDLMVSNCGNLVEIQGNFPPSLKSFAISKCGSLQKLPDLSSSKGLERVEIKDCRKLNVVDLSNLKTLSDLKIIDSVISEIRGLDCLENLNHFQVDTLEQVEILPDLSNLNKLGDLMVSNCGNLVEIQGNFPPSLKSFAISKCGSLQKLPNLSSSKGLKRVEIKDCRKLNVVDLSNLKTLSDLKIIDSVISEIRGFDCLENLNHFKFDTVEQVEILPDLSNLNKLRDFKVCGCENLVEIQGDFPQSLEKFLIWGCRSLQKLPDLSSLKGLKKVQILDCRKLNADAIYSLCLEKGVEYQGDGRVWEQFMRARPADKCPSLLKAS